MGYYKKYLKGEMRDTTHSKKDPKCFNCICDQLYNVMPGTSVFLTLDGLPQGPYTFASFCPEDCCATFVTTTPGSVGGVTGVIPIGSVFIINCNEIEGIFFPPS
ncbi:MULTISPECIES: hypothetical protein [Priestia]|uniref:hypothetical protein n=1 Tax=Priestia TaxID=2800373 RepID=UPI002E20E878|nr:hypothetical protein [Bacillus zanthoxyli]MED3884213.1 hypothetical protein [Priestia aryabhattai]MED4260987.1 hypothetical protein [Priestia aryabhattai]